MSAPEEVPTDGQHSTPNTPSPHTVHPHHVAPLTNPPTTILDTDHQHESLKRPDEHIAFGKDTTTHDGHLNPATADRAAIDPSPEETARLTTLARRMSKMSIRSTTSLAPGADPTKHNPFIVHSDKSHLNPYSPDFNARAWAKATVRLHAHDPAQPAWRTAGFAFRNLNVFGYGSETDYQKTVGGVFSDLIGMFKNRFGSGKRKIQILQDFAGVVHHGELLVVLGPPGSGCSTFLKTIAGETNGFFVNETSYINYQGISAAQMHSDFRGEAIYSAEVDVHFPQLTVGDTLAFAAAARAPRTMPLGVERDLFTSHIAQVVMAIFGISHTINTRVGNDFIRGVSGGERKRVSIAEAALSGAPLQCWDNSTRGLDSANAIEFCKTLRLSTNNWGTTACVAIYQAPQAAYDLFDKVVVLYEGRQIYFGRTGDAKAFWEKVGFQCPARQTTPDFLTSLTSPHERIARPGWERQIPQTPDEFAAIWRASPEYAALQTEIDEFDKKYTIGGEYLDKFTQSRRAQQAKRQKVTSPYTLSYWGQVKLCFWRGFLRLKGDPGLTLSMVFGNTIMALIIGSVFFNLSEDTNSFFGRGSLVFFGILMTAFSSALEIFTLFAQRPIVEKHTRYALYHPSAEAISSMILDLPAKILGAIFFNITLYFLTNLRREAGAFFFFLFASFVLANTMSMMFRTIGAASRSLSQALAPTAIIILALVIYTGFAIPTRNMPGWSRWINYIDPIAYGFESLMINEFVGRDFPCNTIIPTGLPAYAGLGGVNTVCTAVGAIPGATSVSGERYINTAYEYYIEHKWRNVGIMFAMMIILMGTYLFCIEYISAKKSKGEVLLFRRGHLPPDIKRKKQEVMEMAKVSQGMENDPEANVRPDRPMRIESKNADLGPVTPSSVVDQPSPTSPKKMSPITAEMKEKMALAPIFHWEDVCYDVQIKSETRRILDHVAGWVKPGTMTALMGVSGAGKTTLLDVLATRVTMGVVTGDMLVDGRQRDLSFQRKTGYVQQQDLHLETSTVREALEFSALMRQPRTIPRAQKLAYVDTVIEMLEMETFADAVVGVPGEGLNVEQRKRLTIGVELASKPQLLLFLDEPTSGLDSQSSWSICDLMEKLARSGQAILCTIHQPSAILFQRFQRLLLLAKGGKTVYFGDIGHNSSILIDYFCRNGAASVTEDANPAEWMLQVIGAAPGATTEIDWVNVWLNSPERAAVGQELTRLRDLANTKHPAEVSKYDYMEFSAPLGEQLKATTKRVFQQYWRTPSYIYSKIFLCVGSGLFIGFSFFKAGTSLQGLQNQMFSIFMLLTIFGQLSQQIMPHFVTQRALYEVRERPSKAYSWKAFMLSNIFVELPWNTLMAVFVFLTWYYPIGLQENGVATGQVAERGFLMFLFVWGFMMLASTFTHMTIAGIESAEAAGQIGNLGFSLCLIFCGVLVTEEAMPRFWIFMYYVSPFTYIVDGMLATGVANTRVVCSEIEFFRMEPVSGQTCGQYLADWIAAAGGYVESPNATSDCRYCPVDSTNVFLSQVGSSYDNRWRNFGIIFIYIVFNAVMAMFIYWWVRVPKVSKKDKAIK
ncbi:putative ABC transporter [Phlyctochytrium arcticum]|nr:putative ABC transporter [Phlyctochytrium arcticum]